MYKKITHILLLLVFPKFLIAMDIACPDINQQYYDHKTAIDAMVEDAKLYFEQDPAAAAVVIQENLDKEPMLIDSIENDILFLNFSGHIIESSNDYLHKISTGQMYPGDGFFYGLIGKNKRPRESESYEREAKRPRIKHKPTQARRNKVALLIKERYRESKELTFKELVLTFGVPRQTITNDINKLLESNDMTEEENNHIKRFTKRDPQDVEKALLNKMPMGEIISKFKFKNSAAAFQYFISYCDLSNNDTMYLKGNHAVLGSTDSTKIIVKQYFKKVYKKRGDQPFASKKELLQDFNDTKLLGRNITAPALNYQVKNMTEELESEILEFFELCAKR